MQARHFPIAVVEKNLIPLALTRKYFYLVVVADDFLPRFRAADLPLHDFLLFDFRIGFQAFDITLNVVIGSLILADCFFRFGNDICLIFDIHFQRRFLYD